MNKLLKSIYFFSIVLLLSCQKQSVPSIERDFRSAEEQQRLDACSKVDLTNQVFDHYNVQLLFKCTRWDKEFPALDQAIKKMRRDSWNHVMLPLNDLYIKDTERKNRFFSDVRKLDSENGLDDLSYVMQALNETNFFDAFRDLFQCASDPSLEKCQTRKTVPQKRDLIRLIDLMSTNPKAFAFSANVFDHINNALGSEKENFRNNYLKFSALDNFIKFRSQYVSSIMDKFKNGLSDEDRGLITKLLLIGDSEGKAPWLYSWLNSGTMSDQIFLDLVRYPVEINSSFLNDIHALGKIYDQGLNCTFPTTNSKGNFVDFSPKTHVSDYVTLFKDKDIDSFIDFTVKDAAALRIGSIACEELTKNKYNTNFISFANKVTSFLFKKENYELIKFLVLNTTSKGDPSKTYSENLYFADYLAKSIFSNGNEVNRVILESNRDFYPLIFRVLKKFEPKAYVDLAKAMELYLVQNNDPALRSLSELWSFYTEEEKNFLFNFIDRHYLNNTNYTLLFDFYSKQLRELETTAPVLQKYWSGSDENREMSYLALEDLSNNLSGAELKRDMQKFFSRDQVIKVLEILSSGVEVNQAAVRDLQYLYSDNYVKVTRSDIHKFEAFRILGSNSNKNIKNLLGCLEDFSSAKSFYEIVRVMPINCKGMDKEYLGLRIYKWLGDFDRVYVSQNGTATMMDSVLDQDGLFSPMMTATNISLLKILDTQLGDVDSKETGLEYGLKALSKYFYDFKFYNDLKGIDLFSRTFKWMVNVDTYLKDKFEFYRSSLLKEWSDPEKFKNTHPYLLVTNKVMNNYSTWVAQGNYLASKNKTYQLMPDSLKCENYINQQSGPNNCPNKAQVKFHANNIVKGLATVWETDQGSPVKHLIQSVKNGGGMLVPFQSDKPRRYYITLNEGFQSVYDLTDKSLGVNRIQVKYVNPSGVLYRPVLTTMERIENVIREVRFGYNYLGVAYLNYIVAAENYNEEVKSRKKLLETCLKIPRIRCGKSMTDSDLRMARNSLETYDGLLDANNGRGLGEQLKYGQFFAGFQQTLIASSAKAAQERRLLPFDDATLKKHNGIVLGDLAMLSAFSNLGRYLRSRISTDRKEFIDFLNRKDVKLVDNALLRGFNIPNTVVAAENILRKLQVKNTLDGRNLIDSTVDWLSGLSYQESRRAEETIAKLMVVGSYLGTPKDVFGTPLNDQRTVRLTERFKDNNLYDFLLTLNRVIELYPQIEKSFPADAKLVEFFKEISPMVDYLHAQILNEQYSSKDDVYVFVNETYLILKELLFEKRDQLRYGSTNVGITGVDLLIELIKNKPSLDEFINLARIYAEFGTKFTLTGNGSALKILTDNFNKLLSSNKLNASGYRWYIENTSRPLTCFSDTNKCMPNYHYDEPMKLIRLLSSKNSEGNERLYVVADTILKTDLQEINQFIKDLFPTIQLR